MLEFKNRLKNLRKLKSMTQEQLAKRLWVTKSIISSYELGTRFPSVEVLIKLAYVFNVSTDYLLGLDKKRVLDVSNLDEKQLALIKEIVSEFSAKKG